MQIKKSMRTHYRKLRDALPDIERMRASELIARRIKTIPEVASAQSLMTYVSTGSEVNTHGIIADALRAGIAVFTPVVTAQLMAWTRLHRFSDLDLATLQPAAKSLDLQTPPESAPVLVPGIAFDPSGNRLGQGGGHFDRFLPTHKGLRIGIAFTMQIAQDIPIEPHDVPMDYLVTDRNVVRFLD